MHFDFIINPAVAVKYKHESKISRPIGIYVLHRPSSKFTKFSCQLHFKLIRKFTHVATKKQPKIKTIYKKRIMICFS